jgi:hypothetical protein
VVRQQDRHLVEKATPMLLLAMIVLGLATFLAMLAFVKLCDHV